MKIDFPDHPVGEWEYTSWWRRKLGYPTMRRRHWRWIVDWNGCQCVYYWQYTHGLGMKIADHVTMEGLCKPVELDNNDARLA